MTNRQITTQLVDCLFSTNAELQSTAASRLGITDPASLEPEDRLIEIADRLGRREARAALPQLHMLLGHPDALVRASAAGAVAKIEPDLDLPILETLLEEESREVRCRVVKALCDLNAPGVARTLSRILLSLYGDRGGIDPSDDWTLDLRRQMTLMLGIWEDAYALASLTHAARDGDPKVRSNAVWALGMIRDTDTLPVLLQALQDTDEQVRRLAAEALNELRDPRAGDRLLQTLRDPNPQVVVAAVTALAVLRDRGAVPELLRIMGGESDRAARAAAAALSTLDHDLTAPTLIDRLVSPDSDTETKADAAAALGVMGDRDALPHLVTALRSGSVPVRIAAARALGRLGCLGRGFVVPRLAEVLEGEPSAEVMQVTARALGHLGDPSIAYALEAAQKSPNATARQAAQMALVRLGRARITPEDHHGPSHRTRQRAPRLLMKRGTFDQRV